MPEIKQIGSKKRRSEPLSQNGEFQGQQYVLGQTNIRPTSGRCGASRPGSNSQPGMTAPEGQALQDFLVLDPIAFFSV